MKSLWSAGTINSVLTTRRPVMWEAKGWEISGIHLRNDATYAIGMRKM